MTVSSPPAIELVFDRGLRVAGDIVEGEVILYLPSVVAENVSEVAVRLCGGVVTTVTQYQGHGTHLRKDADLVYEECLLWKTGDVVYSEPDSRTLRCPFEFKLPDVLPSSCDFPCFFSGNQGRGTVGYFVEVIGRRTGLHRTIKISSVLPVVSWNTAGATSHAHLTVYGWSGRWKSIGETKDIRRGFRGEKSRVEVSVQVPDIAGLPIDTPVPFMINIVTFTKPTTKMETSADSVWPAPPSRAEDLEFTLEKTCVIRVDKGVEPVFDHLFVTYLGGLGPKGKAKQSGEMTIEKKEKVWLPCEDRQGSKPMGQWKQEVTFRSFFNLNCVPSFETETFSLQYNGHLKLALPGMGNKVKLDVPIRVVSCVPSPEKRKFDAPLPSLDLPASYFKLEGWHAEEQDINLLYY